MLSRGDVRRYTVSTSTMCPVPFPSVGSEPLTGFQPLPTSDNEVLAHASLTLPPGTHTFCYWHYEAREWTKVRCAGRGIGFMRREGAGVDVAKASAHYVWAPLGCRAAPRDSTLFLRSPGRHGFATPTLGVHRHSRGFMVQRGFSLAKPGAGHEGLKMTMKAPGSL